MSITQNDILIGQIVDQLDELERKDKVIEVLSEEIEWHMDTLINERTDVIESTKEALAKAEALENEIELLRFHLNEIANSDLVASNLKAMARNALRINRNVSHE